jgi:hypothetical protein
MYALKAPVFNLIDYRGFFLLLELNNEPLEVENTMFIYSINAPIMVHRDCKL